MCILRKNCCQGVYTNNELAHLVVCGGKIVYVTISYKGVKKIMNDLARDSVMDYDSSIFRVN